MVRAFDSTSTRTLGFDEFQKLHLFLLNVQKSFKDFDRDKGGRLSLVRGAAFCLGQLCWGERRERGSGRGAGGAGLDACFLHKSN